ncbi:MAG: TonB-dependent receptor [Deltaproteobacteria bacterium]|nr:TonB-dependent receptor [Deltaproteobacteria bacterium]
MRRPLPWAFIFGLGLASPASFAGGSEEPWTPAEDAEDSLFEGGTVAPQSPEEVIVGASRRRQSLHEAPAAVSVITAAEIKRFGWRTLGEILGHVRGVYVSTDRNYSFVGIRGFGRSGDYNSRILVLVNGHALNEPIYMGALLGREFGIDVDLIERLEIIRGPGSSQYGPSALMGVINVVTRTGPDLRGLDGVGASGTVEADSLGRLKGAARFDRVEGPGRVFLSASYDQSPGQSFNFPELGLDGWTDPKNDRDRPLNLYTQLSQGPLTLQAGYNDFEKSTATGAYETTPGEAIETRDRRGFVEARLQLEPVSSLSWTTRTYFNYYAYGGAYPYAQEDGGPTVDAAEDFWSGLESFAHWRPLPQLRLLAGGTIQRYFQVEQRVGVGPGANVTSRDYWELAAFGELELTPIQGVTLHAGARVDHLDTISGKLSPRFAAVVTPVAGTTLKLLFSESFRAPNFYELYYTDEVTFRGNPALQPETLRHYELLVEQELNHGAGLLTLSIFKDHFTQLIEETDGDGELGYFINGAGAIITGLEAELNGSLPWAGIRGTLAYSFADARLDATGRRPVNAPAHTLLARAQIPLFQERAHLGLSGRYLGERAGLPGRPAAPDVILLDVTFSVDDVLPGLDLGLGASNVLDARWAAPGGFEHVQPFLPQDGRVVWAKLTATF